MKAGRTINLRSLLLEAAELLWLARESSGAPVTYKRVEDDLLAVIEELDSRAEDWAIADEQGEARL